MSRNDSLVAVRHQSRHRLRRLASALLVMADRVLTFSYFIPTMVGLMDAADSPASVASAMRWAHVNDLRHALVLGGWLAALKTFSLLYQTRSDD